MTQFKRIIVENYKSIAYAELNFLSGIYKVSGDNQDTTYTSNGAGKSSIVQAIVLGLFNKDFTGAPLESLSNRFTGKPYLITVEFETMYNGKLVQVQVTNPAGASRMRVIIDGENAATGSILSVPLIEKMLGMGYNTFKITHFITSSTITNLTQNLSQPTLFNDILHIVELQELDKKLLAVSKDISNKLEEAKSKLHVLEQHSKLAEFKAKYDEKQLAEDLEVLEDSLDAWEAKHSNIYQDLEAMLTATANDLTKLKQTIEQIKLTLRNGVCTMCNTILVDRDTLISLNANITEHEEHKALQQAIYDNTSSRLAVLKKKYLEGKDEIVSNISSIKQDLSIAKEVSSISTVPLDFSVHKELAELEEQALFITTARKEIKSGKVIKNILDQFFGIISVKLQEYLTLIKLEHFEISIMNDRLGMAIVLRQQGVEVPIDSLSNGEKTRLSLLILISMLDAMKVVSDSETNLVILDEAASSFDKSGIEELSNLFSHLKHLGQSIFIITHGSEMQDVPYDFEVLVAKIDGKATALTINL